jgi:3-oxoacyl-[acyl-carrier protein] reductase
MPYELGGLEDKIALVTGAGRMKSIGRSIAVELARAGCDVVLTGTGRSPDSFTSSERGAGWQHIESVAAEIRSLGRTALPLAVDVTDHAAVTNLSQIIESRYGGVDIVVNNASAAIGADVKPIVDVDPGEFRRVLDVNLVGAFHVSQIFGRGMVERRTGGSIVNISSIASKALGAGSAAYAISKAALNAMTVCMAKEVAPALVRVNAICPGLTDTSRTDYHGRDDAWLERVAQIPLRRAGAGVDIAAMVVYLCSEQGSWITGQIWNVDGGTVMH